MTEEYTYLGYTFHIVGYKDNWQGYIDRFPATRVSCYATREMIVRVIRKQLDCWTAIGVRA